MDPYEVMLDAGGKPIEVLCRAAVRRLPPEPYIHEVATLLRDLGGLTVTRQKHARKIVQRWSAGRQMSSVPSHCWALLLGQLPASSLRERLAQIGGAP